MAYISRRKNGVDWCTLCDHPCGLTHPAAGVPQCWGDEEDRQECEDVLEFIKVLYSFKKSCGG
jgi:hypothetical protein